MDPLQWMGAVWMRVQTADKKNHNNPQHNFWQSTSDEVKSSFWRHPFTAEDPLVSKWYNAKFLQICSDEETNSFTFWMAWG